MLLEALAPSTANQIYQFVMLLDYDRTVRVLGQTIWTKTSRGKHRARIKFVALSEKSMQTLAALAAGK